MGEARTRDGTGCRDGEERMQDMGEETIQTRKTESVCEEQEFGENCRNLDLS